MYDLVRVPMEARGQPWVPSSVTPTAFFKTSLSTDWIGELQESTYLCGPALRLGT